MKTVNEAKVPMNAVLSTLGLCAVCILGNHIEYLIRVADFGLSALLLLVAAAATKSVVDKGKIPWIEAPTTVALAGLAGLSFVR
jgi:hypothetical protein